MNATYNGKELAKSKVISKNLSPHWNEKFEVQAETKHYDEEVPLLIELFDSDKGNKSDNMGEVLLPMPKLLEINGKAHWHAVMPSPDCRDGTGALRLNVGVTMPSHTDTEETSV